MSDPKFDIKKIINIGAAVATVLATQAASPQTDLTPKDATKIESPITKAVEKAVVEQVQPVIDHLTNNESSIWAKRTTYAWLVSLILTLATPWAARLGYNMDWIDESLKNDIVTTATTIGGLWAAYAAWRAGSAIKPLF